VKRNLLGHAISFMSATAEIADKHECIIALYGSCVHGSNRHQDIDILVYPYSDTFDVFRFIEDICAKLALSRKGSFYGSMFRHDVGVMLSCSEFDVDLRIISESLYQKFSDMAIYDMSGKKKGGDDGFSIKHPAVADIGS
jgi:predicted nucleotidyltransferase